MKKERTQEDILRALGVWPTRAKKKYLPKGKDLVRVRNVVRLVNKKVCPDKPKFCGFFPTIENPELKFYVATSNFYLDESPVYRHVQKIVKKMYPDLNVHFVHLYSKEIYYNFTRNNGIYII
jgi:hypothetical protein